MRRRLPWATAALGAALLVAGTLVFAITDPPRPAAFGWSAYAPLSTEQAYASRLSLTFDDGAVVWGGQQLVGGGIGVAGLLLLAALAGWALGRRPVRTSAP
jgi:hypothetical protein